RYRWDWGWVWWLGLRLEVAPVVPVPAYSCCLLGWLLELAVCVWGGWVGVSWTGGGRKLRWGCSDKGGVPRSLLYSIRNRQAGIRRAGVAVQNCRDRLVRFLLSEAISLDYRRNMVIDSIRNTSQHHRPHPLGGHKRRAAAIGLIQDREAGGPTREGGSGYSLQFIS
ncbi:hypothetical protein SUGI_1499930, partial [Cryptomeria japonica]